MATYAALTDAQKTDLASFDSFERGLFASLMSLYIRSNPMGWATFAAANCDPLTAQLGDTEVIPNSTLLTGAKDLTAAEFKQLQAIGIQLMTLANTNMPLIVKAIGINATQV